MRSCDHQWGYLYLTRLLAVSESCHFPKDFEMEHGNIRPANLCLIPTMLSHGWPREANKEQAIKDMYQWWIRVGKFIAIIDLRYTPRFVGDILKNNDATSWKIFTLARSAESTILNKHHWNPYHALKFFHWIVKSPTIERPIGPINRRKEWLKTKQSDGNISSSNALFPRKPPISATAKRTQVTA